ncbi:NAD(P)H-dependent glycerol-3-phosphate dehydrogenase [Rubrivirga sp. IMCC43871]|uniref:NAD(P)H-dependent glycerol-3-phosphate dehydrogenase n=1 Tax=Rubrivirga sp. IMCC43871 TaxID=3391575 RepID=UPI00398FDC11
MTPTPIAVLGAGSWGTALAASLAPHHPVRLWARRPEAADEIARTRRNERYLPGADLPAEIDVTSDLNAAIDGAGLWVVAVPSQSVRGVMGPLADRAAGVTIASVAKGIENGTLLTTSAVLRDVLPAADSNRVGVLYGPSHAEEVAREMPTSIVAAFPDEGAARAVQQAFMRPALRVYTNTDLVGVEIGGSVKNVMAVAAGMSDGLGLGDNAKAALVTRGLAEITRLGLALGADAHTFAGLAGLGDLVVTCFSRHSRNRAFGERVGRGESADDALAQSSMVVEGVRTTQSVKALAERHGVEMPITDAVYAILFEGLAPVDAVGHLMERDPKLEGAHFDTPAFDGTEA